MKKSLLTTTALIGAMSSLAAGSANAVDVKLYGTVNKASMYYDDGRTTDFTVVDNNLESTRFGLAGEKQLDNGLTASALFEVDMTSNSSNVITQNGNGNTQSSTPTNDSSPAISERMARVGLAGSFGAVFIGQQDVATDDAYGHDLAAANSVMNANVAAFGGGLVFKRTTGAPILVNTVSATASGMALGMDGATDTADSIRYNTPTYMGFNGSISAAQGGDVDATVRYAGSMGDFSLDSALGIKMNNDNTGGVADVVESQTFASASVKHSSGLAGTVAYTAQSLEEKTATTEEPSGLYLKAGYAWDAFGVAVDYATFEDGIVGATRSELTSYGLGGEYDLGNGVVAGALYRNYEADVTGITNAEDIDVFALNMRVKF